VLQSIALLPNYSFWSFSSTLSLCFQHPFPSSPNLSPHYPTHILTTCWPTYCTNFVQPQPLQSLTQAPYTTTT
jgi:hypothetical protein